MYHYLVKLNIHTPYNPAFHTYGYTQDTHTWVPEGINKNFHGSRKL